MHIKNLWLEKKYYNYLKNNIHFCLVFNYVLYSHTEYIYNDHHHYLLSPSRYWFSEGLLKL
jgi:hypothetical protein